MKEDLKQTKFKKKCFDGLVFCFWDSPPPLFPISEKRGEGELLG